MRLKKGDRISTVEVIEPDGDLLLLTASGYGKRTALDEFSPQGRAGGGVIALGQAQQNGGVVASRVVQAADNVVIISQDGLALRMEVEKIPRLGRSARGSRLINLREGDRAVSIARIEPEAEAEKPADSAESPAEADA